MSIRKGDTLLAGSVVTYPKPNWDRSIQFTAAQLYAGYTAPEDGMLVLRFWNATSSTGTVKINNIFTILTISAQQSGITVPNALTTPVSRGDVVKNNMTMPENAVALYFVPWM